MAITGVVVIPKRGKIKGTWMGSSVLVMGERMGDVVSDGASGGFVDSRVADMVYM